MLLCFNVPDDLMDSLAKRQLSVEDVMETFGRDLAVALGQDDKGAGAKNAKEWFDQAKWPVYTLEIMKDASGMWSVNVYKDGQLEQGWSQLETMGEILALVKAEYPHVGFKTGE